MGIFGWSYPPGCNGTPYDEFTDEEHCPECGRELESVPYDVTKEVPSFLEEGYCSPECERGEERPILTRVQERKLQRWEKQARELVDKARNEKVDLSIDSLFEIVPEGDFRWDDNEAGDWHVYCCGEKDCPVQWHKVAYSTDYGRKDGKRFVELRSVDEDGNWDYDGGFNEGDLGPHDIEDTLRTLQMQSTEYFYGWFQYWAEAARTGEDILGECTKDNPTPEDFLEYAKDNLKYLKK